MIFHRCKYKSTFNYTITIDEANLNKIVKKIKEPIAYKKSSVKYPEHICKNKKFNINNNQNIQMRLI